jgi:hypothetical protein
VLPIVTWLPHFGSCINGIFTLQVRLITSCRKLKSYQFGITYILKFDSGIMYTSSLIRICFRTYKTIILPVVLYGCEALSLSLREEHRLRLYENRVLRRIFGPKRDEVTGV